MSTPKQPTKQERRDAARAARAQAEQAEAASAQRKKRLTVILGAIGVVAVIAIVLIATSGGSEGGEKKAGEQLDGVSDVAAMLKDVPQTGITLGDPKAKVTVVEFIDPQCPICKAFGNDVLPTIVQDYVRPGKVQYQTQTLSFLGPDSVKGAQFLQAAAMQNKMYNATETLYRNQGTENTGYMTDTFLRQIGDSIPGFDTDKAMVDMKSAKAQEGLATANTAAQRYGVSGTPTLLVGPTGGTLAKINADDPSDVDAFKSGIDAALKLQGQQ